MAHGLEIGWSAAECLRADTDPDRDGTDEGCELALARAFAPRFIVSDGACNWDDSVGPGRLGGEYYFAAQRARGPGSVRIAYLPAYYLDCGWSGPKCWLWPRHCAAHTGDSEAVVVEAVRFPVLSPRQNIGSRARPVETAYGRGCVGADHLGWGSRGTMAGRWECFWLEDAHFRGWQWPWRGSAPTPYFRYLAEIAGF